MCEGLAALPNFLPQICLFAEKINNYSFEIFEDHNYSLGICVIAGVHSMTLSHNVKQSNYSA